MSPAFTRSSTAHSATLSLFDKAQVVTWHTPTASQAVHQTETISLAYARSTSPSANQITPPYHWHHAQQETFIVKRGTFIFTLEGRSFPATAASDPVVIPARQRHSFRLDPAGEEDGVIEIAISKEDGGISERFFRNLYSYLDDCVRAGKTPHPLQMLVFIEAADVSLGLPGPAAVALLASRVLGWVGGRWVGPLLGYKSTYAEYYDAEFSERAGKSNVGVKEVEVDIGGG